MKVPNNITMSQYIALLNAVSIQCYSLNLAQLSYDRILSVVATVGVIDKATEEVL
jgi:hypothetical protein